jgi:hypothetical protein
MDQAAYGFLKLMSGKSFDLLNRQARDPQRTKGRRAQRKPFKLRVRLPSLFEGGVL